MGVYPELKDRINKINIYIKDFICSSLNNKEIIIWQIIISG